jgi:hypothetical protein
MKSEEEWRIETAAYSQNRLNYTDYKKSNNQNIRLRIQDCVQV